MKCIYDDKLLCWIEYDITEPGCYPDKNGVYLVCNMDYENSEVEIWEYFYGSWSNSYNTYTHITHWRYLPELPKV